MSVSLLLVPLVLAANSHGVDISPKGVVLVCLGGVAQFTCSRNEYDKYAHFEIHRDDISKYAILGVQSFMTEVLATLKVPGLLQFNNSNVSCVSYNGSSGPTALIVLGSSIPTIVINCSDDHLTLHTLTHIQGQSYGVVVMVPNGTVLLNTTAQDLQSPISMKGCELCTPCTIAVQAVCNGSAGAPTYLNYSVPHTTRPFPPSTTTSTDVELYQGTQPTASPLMTKSPWRSTAAIAAGTSVAGVLVALCVGLSILLYCCFLKRNGQPSVTKTTITDALLWTPPGTPLYTILPPSSMTPPPEQTSSEGGTVPSEWLRCWLPSTQCLRGDQPSTPAACPPPHPECFAAQHGDCNVQKAPVNLAGGGSGEDQQQGDEHFLSKDEPVSNKADQPEVVTGQLGPSLS